MTERKDVRFRENTGETAPTARYLLYNRRTQTTRRTNRPPRGAHTKVTPMRKNRNAAPATPELDATVAQVEVTEQVAQVETTAAPESTLIALVYDKQIGIIGHLRSKLGTPEGVTKGEMNVRLVELFPDRDAMGMATTVQIQLGRLQKKYGRIVSVMVEGRGRVYGFEATLEVAKPVAPAATEEIAQVA